MNAKIPDSNNKGNLIIVVGSQGSLALHKRAFTARITVSTCPVDTEMTVDACRPLVAIRLLTATTAVTRIFIDSKACHTNARSLGINLDGDNLAIIFVRHRLSFFVTFLSVCPNCFLSLSFDLKSYDGPETAMKRRPPLNGYRNRPPDQPPPWRHDFPGSYGGGYSDSHRDEARTFYSGDGGRDGGDGSDVGDTGGQNHNSQSAKLDPRTQHSETAAIPHLVNALHRPDYYGPPLTPAVNVDAARVLGSNDTFRAQINSGTETYYSNSNTHYTARTSRQSSGTFPLGSEGGDARYLYSCIDCLYLRRYCVHV